MTAKQYLYQLRRLDDTINAKFKQVDELRCLTEKVTSAPSPDRVQASQDQDKTASIIAKIVDLQHDINNDIDKLIDLKAEIIALIDTIGVDEYRLLLTKRYVNCETWGQIAVDMGYTYQWVCGGLHGRALVEFDTIYKKVGLVDSN